MTAPIDLVLSRLAPFKLRENGRDRWRAQCPGHGGSNPSALSVGVGDNGSVLLKCWRGCSADEVAGAIGLELQDLFPARSGAGGGSSPVSPRRLVSNAQALALVHDKAHFVAVCAAAQARGEILNEKTREQLLTASAYIVMVTDEVAS